MKAPPESLTSGEILLDMVLAARRERGVASLFMPDGTHLFAYPDDRGVIIGIGRGSEEAHQVQSQLVLRRRTENPARYGLWLPALLSDGCWFLLRRLSVAEALDTACLERIDIDVARSLLFL